jgi:arsenate reductase (thioredoxin)
MADHIYNVLFLCTGNSARSIIAEVMLNRLGRGRFRTFSAGSHPKGEVNPLTLRVLQELRLPADGLRCKNWDEFARPGAPVMDFIFTVCDKAAGEACPVWPGQPMTAHWGVQDPAVAEGTDAQRLRVFERVARELETRIRLFTALRLEELDRMSLKRRLDHIGRGGTGQDQ